MPQNCASAGPCLSLFLRACCTVCRTFASKCLPGSACEGAAAVTGQMGKGKSVAPKHGFASTLAKVIADLRRAGRGCRHCSTGQCYVAFQFKLKDLERWRVEFQSLPAMAQEHHLSWMFWHRPATQAQLSHCRPPKDGEQRAVVTSEDEDDCLSAARAPRLPTSSEDESPRQLRDDTTEPSEEEEEELDIACSDGEAQKPEPKQVPKRREYGEGPQRQGRFSVTVFGQALCVKAAKALLGVGQGKLYRIKNGLTDGRRDGTRGVRGLQKLPMNAPKLLSVLKFLWRLYQSVGEGMPDKFSFKKKDAKTLVLEPSGDGLSIQEDRDSTQEFVGSECSSDPEGALRDMEEEERSITAAALFAETSRHPSEAILHGPGMPTGPLRFLPPTRRVHLFWEYVAWCQSQGLEAASFHTFLRAFAASRNRLRIRTAGEHAKCDVCMKLKANIRKQVFPKDRQAAIESYTRHILDQWLDRQVYGHAAELSLQLRQMLCNGHLMSILNRSVSQMAMIIDGIEQAKFRTPRVLTQGHALKTLLRPALHVQGAWCHGFGYHLAVSDADMLKDTNNNVEVISRLLSCVYDRHKGLPQGLHLQQDNTSRECKNQYIINWAAKLVALRVFSWVTLAYLITGHTHEDIDGTFGQLTVKMAAEEWDDDKQLLSMLARLLSSLGTDRPSREAAAAYKLDEAADWHSWWSENNLSLSHMTGPNAPHWFRVCLLGDVGAAHVSEQDVPVSSPAGMPGPDPGDVVVVVRSRMASPSVQQVLRMVPASACQQMRFVQPQGVVARRLGAEDVKTKVARKAEALHLSGVLRAAARDYLVGWATGTRVLEPRPPKYSYLEHRQGVSPPRGEAALQPPPAQLVQVDVRRAAARRRPRDLPDDALAA